LGEIAQKTLDHSAGFCIRGATVIRVNPTPAGFEKYATLG
jgi:hypothetical protein